MSAINLNKGLEGLYYFDEQNFDSQRNLLRDHSGYARHAEASGGPTVGVEGPNDFGATSFDGIDDKFESSLNYPDIQGSSGEFSIFVIAKSDDTGNREYFSNGINNQQSGHQINANTSVPETSIALGTGNTKPGNSFDIDPTQWVVAGISYAGGTPITTFCSDFNEVLIKTNDNNSTFEPNGREISVGWRPASNEYSSVYISTFGVWSRAITTAEIFHLSRLTAPLEAQL